jgi:hypothetical protein
MSRRTPDSHVPFDALVDYWLGDIDESATQAIDEHLLACDACGKELDEVIGLAQGVQRAFFEGLAHVFVSAGFVDRLAQRGLRVREHRVPHNGSVNCSVAPDDDVLVSRLQVPLEGVSRVDAVASVAGHPDQWRYDVPFDAASGEVLFAPKLAQVRELPAHDLRLRLLAVDEGGSREIGHYTLHHTPWG